MSKITEYHKTTFPAISLDKIIFFHRVRVERGISAFESSFILGKRDLFVRDVENPFKTNIIDSEDSLQLAKLHSLESYSPPTNQIDLYRLDVEEEKFRNKVMKRIITITNDTISSDPIEIEEEDKETELSTPLHLSTYEQVQKYCRELIDNGYFMYTRTALEVFDLYRSIDIFGANFHPRFLIKSLRYFTNKKSGEPILDNSRTNLFSRRLFYKPINFNIDSNKGLVSKAFCSIDIASFQEAAQWVKELSYQRNKDKNKELAVFDEQCGTCSTKHALLKRLADENGNQELRLMLGIFTMNAKNTPAIKDVLKKYKLKYIPEAHNYLRAYNYILDYTGIGINETKLELEIIQETEIQPEQITDFKVSYHKEYLRKWIIENKISYTLEEIWKIREECIEAIAKERHK